MAWELRCRGMQNVVATWQPKISGVTLKLICHRKNGVTLKLIFYRIWITMKIVPEMSSRYMKVIRRTILIPVDTCILSIFRRNDDVEIISLHAFPCDMIKKSIKVIIQSTIHRLKKKLIKWILVLCIYVSRKSRTRKFFDMKFPKDNFSIQRILVA